MNHTTMKATAVISEAWRSITSGAARLFMFNGFKTG